MNIFAFDPDPWQSALWLDDVRKNKMIVETAQLLSTAIRYDDPFTSLPVYRSAYVNHPCTVWTRKSTGNFKWLLEYFNALVEQRGGRHKTAGLRYFFQDWLDTQCVTSATPFPNCTTYKEEVDTHLAYRLYMQDKWKVDVISLSWHHGEKPQWN